MKVITHDTADAETFVFSDKLDRELLEQNYKSRLKLAYRIYVLFINTTQAEIDTITQAANVSDFKMVNDTIHKIKNNFLHVGLSETHKLLTEMDTASKNQSNFIKELSKKLELKYANDLIIIKDQLKDIKLHLTARNIAV